MMLRTKWMACFLCLLINFNLHSQSDEKEEVELSEDQLNELLAHFAWADSVNNQFTYDSGTVVIGNDLAIIEVPKGFRFLNPAQTKIVLEEIWGNPPQDDGYLGMLFPSEYGPADAASWAINISFERDGYVEDEDAEDIDYDELLEQMKEDTRAASQQRVEMGYEAIQLIGWGEQPYYDDKTHKLFWAKEIQFGEKPEEGQANTLNYNIRILGRKGVLMLNAIATMDDLSTVRENLDNILASVEFKQGNRYEEFNPDIDEVAAYGIGGLIAGKVLAKAGILALLAKFGKFIFVGVVAAAGVVRKFFFGSKSSDA